MSNPFSKYIASGIEISALSDLPERQKLDKEKRYLEQVQLVERIILNETLQTRKRQHTFIALDALKLSKGDEGEVAIFEVSNPLKLRLQNLRRNLSRLGKSHEELKEATDLRAKFITNSLAEIKRGDGKKFLWVYIAFFCETHEDAAKDYFNDIGLNYPSDETPNRLNNKKEIENDDLETDKANIIPSDTLAKKPNKKREIKRDWLDPYNIHTIPFRGRKAELAQLDAFVKPISEADFKIWTIVAPSGAGKTRLTYEWIRRPNISENWDIAYLQMDMTIESSQSDHIKKSHLTFWHPDLFITPLQGISKNGQDWSSWSPQRPQILIIDSIFGYEEIIKGLVRRALNQELNHAVRLLVLDRKFPEDLNQLNDDIRWAGLSYDGERLSRVKTLFYNTGIPLDLSSNQKSNSKSKSNSDESLRSIIRHISKPLFREQKGDKKIEEALVYLKRQSNAQYPLFAALVGEAIRLRQDYSQWNRRELAYYYLKGQERLPWENKSLSENDAFWAASLVCAATLRQNLTVLEFKEWRPSVDVQKPADVRSTFDVIERLIGKPISSTLPPLGPDFLGETFFLTFLSHLKHRPLEFEAFCELLSCGKAENLESVSLQVIAFLRKVIGNLLNDDKNQPEHKENWASLDFFLTPTNFKNAEPMRWTVSIALMHMIDEIVSTLEGSALTKPIIQSAMPLPHVKPYPDTSYLFKKIIDQDCLPKATHSSEFAFEVARHAISYFKFKNDISHLDDETLELLANALIEYDGMDLVISVLDIAIYFDFTKCALALINRMETFEYATPDGITTLMHACNYKNDYSRESVAIALIKKMPIIDQTADGDVTAFMLACANGLQNAAIDMMPKTEAIDQPDKSGRTALFYACLMGSSYFVQELIDRRANVNQITNDDQTPLQAAVISGHKICVEILLSQNLKCLDIVCELEGIKYTALDLSRKQGYPKIEKLLLEAGCKTYAQIMGDQ